MGKRRNGSLTDGDAKRMYAVGAGCLRRHILRTFRSAPIHLSLKTLHFFRCTVYLQSTTISVLRNSNTIAPLHLLILVICAYAFFPIRILPAQESSAETTIENEVFVTHVQGELRPHNEPTPPLTKDKKSSTSRLDPRQMSPEEGTVIGDGDQMIMSNNFVQIHGNALIKSQEVVLHADHIWADFNDNVMRASGNVRLIIDEEVTFADDLIFDLETKKGIARDGFTFDDPWYFSGSDIFKIEDDESYIRGGRLTTCSLKQPHFYFSASQIIVKLNKELIAKNIVLKIGGVPLFYFPVIRRDLRKEDKMAKIIVKLGTDSYQGPFASIILPIFRRYRYSTELLFDQSTRRGRGGGAQAKYRVNDVKFQEIFIPVLPDATPAKRAKLKEKADQLSDLLRGEHVKYTLRQIFLEYRIKDEDVARAREEAEILHAQLKEKEIGFSELAQKHSDHQETRHRKGDLGFLVRGERSKRGTLVLEPHLEEAVFHLQPGDITPILRTNFAFHILTVDHLLDVYGEKEIQVRRIDIAIEPNDATRSALRNFGNEIQKRTVAGEPLEQLATEYDGAELTTVNSGNALSLSNMNPQWKHSVRRLEKSGDITRPVYTDRGVHVFQLIEKESAPTFEAIAQQFAAEWEAIKKETMEPKRVAGLKTNRDSVGRATRVAEKRTSPIRTETESSSMDASTENVDVEQAVQVYKKHGFRGKWENLRPISSQAQRLDRGETSRVIKTLEGYHLIKVEKKRTYRGDFIFLSQDQYSTSRREAFSTGQRWTMRWAHHQSIYTPWDNREQGRRPLSFNGRVAWQARNFKEGYGTTESTVNSFGIFTWGSALSALDPEDLDANENLTFSRKRFGNFLARLQVNHTLDLTEEGTTTLQKLPQVTVQFSQMQFNQLPLFKAVNSGLTKLAETLHSDVPILSMLAFPTLENTRFDLDLEFGNFFKQRFRDETDVFLQTLDIGFDLTKQTTLKISRQRELRLDLSLDSSLIWHARDREGNRNILLSLYGLSARGSNTLFRIYDISFIPGARRMRHQIQSNLSFDYQPPVDRNENLYPFGPSTYFFERKRCLISQSSGPCCWTATGC